MCDRSGSTHQFLPWRAVVHNPLRPQVARSTRNLIERYLRESKPNGTGPPGQYTSIVVIAITIPNLYYTHDDRPWLGLGFMVSSPLYIATNIVIAILSTTIVTIIILVVICPTPVASPGDVEYRTKNKRASRAAREALQGRLYAASVHGYPRGGTPRMTE